MQYKNKDAAQKEALNEFLKLAMQRDYFPARPAILSQIIACIIIRAKQENSTIEDATNLVVGQFLTVPFTKAMRVREKKTCEDTTNITPRYFTLNECLPPEGKDEEALFEQYLAQPLRLLSTVLLHSPEDVSSDTKKLFTPAVFNYLAGISLLNSREVNIYSPFHAYFEKIQQSQQAFPFLPILFKTETTYGGKEVF